mmetsp:Transcript_32375/g.62233  ORF Transcript_32375/g.62233 Transcript_32375/m.62233 type:complete len:88 (+) Transcript_32375:928-1191(+)
MPSSAQPPTPSATPSQFPVSDTKCESSPPLSRLSGWGMLAAPQRERKAPAASSSEVEVEVVVAEEEEASDEAAADHDLLEVVGQCAL